MPETVLVESGLDEAGLPVLIVQLLKLGWRDIADRPQQSFVVISPDPIQCLELDIVEAPPRPVLTDHFGLVEDDDRLGERVDSASALS